MSHPHRIPRLAAAALGIALLAVAPARAGDEEEPTPAQEVIRGLLPSFAHVEISLRYDEGEPPTVLAGGTNDYSGYLAEERPVEVPGIVLAPDRVLISDPQIPDRFVAGIAVVAGETRIPARADGWVEEWDGALLRLESPLPGAKTPAFDAAAAPPYRAVFHGKRDGLWMTVVGPALERITVDEEGLVTADAWSPSVIVDRKGTPVGVALSGTMPVSDAWKGSPLGWETLTTEERAALVSATEAQADACLVRVHARLRSPKKEGRASTPFSFQEDEEGDETERNAAGVLVDPTHVLVLDALDAKATARLETVDVHPKEGDPVPARFVCSFQHYGALLVETERPLPGPARLSTVPVRALRDHFLLDARLEVQGEGRVLKTSHARISSYDEGWRRQIVPSVGGSAKNHFLFDREGRLVCVPIERRVPTRDRRWRDDDPVLLPGQYLAPLMADPQSDADPANVPVPAERENRIAWLGVEIQRLDRDLARANGVSHLTQDGRTGGLVSYVYEGSPAAAAGIEPGVVLLRIHTPERPRPIDVAASEDPYSRFRGMLEGLDDAMEERFGDMMGGMHPWPSAENDVNRVLTEIGFGKPITLEYVVAGEVKTLAMTVTEGPVHYEAAPLHKSEDLGTTVRDLTYEVRRYYQLEPALQGVIVSKVERGSRAAVAGLRRFDVVLRVNDQPVPDAAAFGKAIEAEGELRLAVKDKLKERIVKITR